MPYPLRPLCCIPDAEEIIAVAISGEMPYPLRPLYREFVLPVVYLVAISGEKPHPLRLKVVAPVGMGRNVAISGEKPYPLRRVLHCALVRTQSKLQSLARSPTPCDFFSHQSKARCVPGCNLWREAPPLATAPSRHFSAFPFRLQSLSRSPTPFYGRYRLAELSKRYSCNLWREAPPHATMYYCPGCAIDREMLQSLARSPTPCDRMAA